MKAPQPIHTDKYRGSGLQLISPAVAGILVLLGLIGFDPISLMLGVGLAIYTGYTRHARYEIYSNGLLVRFMLPRRQAVPFTEIEEVGMVKLSMVGEVLAVRKKGKGMGLMLLRPSDPDLFLSKLNEARGGTAE